MIASKKQRHVLYMALCCVWKPVTSGLFGGDKMRFFADWDEWLQFSWLPPPLHGVKIAVGLPLV